MYCFFCEEDCTEERSSFGRVLGTDKTLDIWSFDVLFGDGFFSSLELELSVDIGEAWELLSVGSGFASVLLES